MLLHRFATFVAVVCFGLLLVGGLVHNTNSGLACGTDWPRCTVNGVSTFTPKMEGNVLVEHGHRLAAATVGLLTIATLLLALRGRAARRGVRGLAGVALALVGAQGVLGALTVKLGLSAAASTAHLGMSMLFFATLVAIATRARPATARAAMPSGKRALVGAAIVLVYAQMLLGAAVRHLGAGMICGNE